jgi:hypothetical protein
MRMKQKREVFTEFRGILVALCILALSSAAQAEKVGVADAAVAVDVIVNIDRATRTSTLKNEQEEEWIFVAGPEVRNFDQLQRGDLVLMEYVSGLAIALEPRGSGLKERISEIEVERARAGDKPGVKITENTYATAQITAIDAERGVVTVAGARGSLVLKAGEELEGTLWRGKSAVRSLGVNLS